MHDLSGTQLDRYSIHYELGQGGMARVYLVHDTNLKRDVALKILTPEMSADADSVARFLREARAVSKLDHPNIVHVHDTGHEGGYYYIAMRYVDGCTLRQRLTEGPLTTDEASEILTQIASALDYAHGQGVMHRDIKPENILIDRAGNALLTDFGIASAADEISVTVTGKVIGTPVYMAPEQLRGEPASIQSEVYALGILAYELLTGTTPFAGRPAHAIMLAHLDERPRPMDRIRSEIPLAAVTVVDRSLAKDPARRFVSAGEFASELASALHGAPAPLSPGDMPTVVGTRVRLARKVGWTRTPKWLAFTSLGMMVGLLLLGVSMLNGNETFGSEGDDPEVVSVRLTPTPAVQSTPSPQQPESVPEPVMPVLHQDDAGETTDTGENSPPVDVPVVDSVEEAVEAPSEEAPQQVDEHNQEPPAEPATDGDPAKPEKEKQEKKEEPDRSANPGNSGNNPGNSGNPPGQEKKP